MNNMNNMKNIALIFLVVILTAGCGTDSIENLDESNRLQLNTDELIDEISEQQTYSSTIIIDNGSASAINLTSFSENGDWLVAELINNGSAIELRGVVPEVRASQESQTYGYTITAVQAEGLNAHTSFSIEVTANRNPN